MSDASERPFEATPRRLAKARSEGNIARSSELGANLSFAAGALCVVAIAPLFNGLAGGAIATAAAGFATTHASAAILAVACAPIAAAATGVVASLVQNAGVVAVPVAPKIERLNPLEGFKRILSRETFAHSLRATAAFICALTAIFPTLAWSAASLLRADHPLVAAADAWTSAREVATAAVGVGLCFSLAEYGAARSAWLRKLRMSLDDRKREAKEEEGDAVVRGRRRALHRALLRSGIEQTKEATFVVANPTHVAVALEYRPPAIAVPRVLVRAIDAGAQRVRRIAETRGIPVVENPLLARALYHDGREGEPIPHAHYVAVAEVVAALLRLKEIGASELA
ncbi:MAG: EscU/YscU/HrcU family type III secretion system export apparatus switch protein [Candidatus Cybelea sp.]